MRLNWISVQTINVSRKVDTYNLNTLVDRLGLGDSVTHCQEKSISSKWIGAHWTSFHGFFILLTFILTSRRTTETWSFWAKIVWLFLKSFQFCEK